MTDAIEYVLTPQDKDLACLIAIELERQRRERNARDAKGGVA